MKRLQAITMFGVLAAGLALAPAFAAGPTVGNLYTRLAQAKKLDAATPAAAEASLRGAGVALPALALDKALTEGDVASVAGAMGLKVTTTRPGSIVNDVQLDSFVAGLNNQIQDPAKGGNPYQVEGTGTGGVDPGNSGNGKGKKKGHNKSPSEPL